MAEIINIDVPVATRLQEANDVATLLEDATVRDRLVRVGLLAETVVALVAAITALRTAQSVWTVTRDRSKSAAQKKREDEGALLRGEILAACDWSLRDDVRAVAVLARVREGDGVADLIQDLEDLAQLVETHQDKFGADQTFDAAGRIEEARRVASDIRAGLSTTRLSVDQEQARSVRDEAYLKLAGVLAAIRDAGRYAFRKEPAVAARFGSAYLRRKRAARRNGAGEAAAESEVESGSEVGAGAGAQQ
jgi:hypothetical protein